MNTTKLTDSKLTDSKLTDSELLVLGLIAEMPRHGYQLEQVIEQRGMREWTQIGFSSIYFLLNKLEKKQLIQSEKPKTEKPRTSKARKSYRLTPQGNHILVAQTLQALEQYRASNSSLLMGMLHWPNLTQEQALTALKKRRMTLQNELSRLKDIRFKQLPLPDHLDIMFDFSLGQLNAEYHWVNKTYQYMKNKVWN